MINPWMQGNALPAHDIETNLFGTSLGVDRVRGVGGHGGQQHHLRAINAIREADMIRMLSTMLHAIGTGNMTPAGLFLDVLAQHR